MKENKKAKKEKPYGLVFLILVILTYLIILPFKPEGIHKSIVESGNLLIRIIPIILLVIFFMGIINYYVKPKTVSKYVGQGSGIKGWLLAVSTGILSHGPIYAWYPLLSDLRKQGMRSGLVAAFLYNRAIKIPLLPLMIYYFGMPLVVVLLVYMLIASVIEGLLIDVFEQ
ncbi:MAG TPA: permease [archaeon]|nr:permease [archaeon]